MGSRHLAITLLVLAAAVVISAVVIALRRRWNRPAPLPWKPIAAPYILQRCTFCLNGLVTKIEPPIRLSDPIRPPHFTGLGGNRPFDLDEQLGRLKSLELRLDTYGCTNYPHCRAAWTSFGMPFSRSS